MSEQVVVDVNVDEVVRRHRFTPDQLATVLENMYNSFSSDAIAPKLAAALLCEHRTLQQSVIRGLFRTLVEMGRQCPSFGTDDRNEAGIALCKKLAEMDVYLPLV